jgi:hypothetical protein
MTKMKMVLRDEYGQVDHTQGVVDVEKFGDAGIVKRDGKLYRYHDFKYENGMLVGFYHEDVPCEALEITEF